MITVRDLVTASSPFHGLGMAWDEVVLWSVRAQRGAEHSRQVAGSLLFTTDRVVFVPNDHGRPGGEELWACPRAGACVSVCSGAWRPRNTLMNWIALQSMVMVDCVEGGTEYFWLRHPASWARRRVRHLVVAEASADAARAAPVVSLEERLSSGRSNR